MICPFCGRPARDEAAFCTQCGADLRSSRQLMDLSEEEQTILAPEADSWLEDGQYIPERAAQSAPEVPEKRPGGVWTVLLIAAGMLLVAVLTFVLIRMLTGRDNGGETVVHAAEDISIVAVESAQPTVPQVLNTPAPTPTPTPTLTPTPIPEPEYLLPDSATRYLAEADLSGLSHEQLCFARNEIYARHGRMFSTPEIAAYFAGKSWYHGTIRPEDFNSAVLNAYERANVGLISDYEQKHFGGSYY